MTEKGNYKVAGCILFFLIFFQIECFAVNVFTISNKSSTTDTNFSLVVTAIDTAATSVANQLNNTILSDSSRAGFLNKMATAGTAGAKSLTQDYHSNPSIVTVGVGANVGLPIGQNLAGGLSGGTNSLPALGVSAQPSIHLGLNLGTFFGGKEKSHFFGLDRLVVGANFFTLSLSTGGVTVGATNFGAGAQYKFFGPIGPAFLAQWGGLDVGLGFAYHSMTASYATAFNVPVSLATGTGSDSVNVSWASNLTLGVFTSNVAIPLEITTNFTLLYVLTGFFGLGADFNIGSSKMTGGGSGPITATYSGTLTAPSNLYSATGTLDFTNAAASAIPAFDARVIAGFAVNLWAIKPFVQYHYMSNGAYLISMGTRFAI